MSSHINKSGNNLNIWERLGSWSPSGQDIMTTARPLMRESSKNNTSLQEARIKKIEERLEKEQEEIDIEKNYSSVSTENILGSVDIKIT